MRGTEFDLSLFFAEAFEMCLAELIAELRRAGVKASESQIRWAIKTGKISRPQLDGSHRFVFRAENVAEIATQFANRRGGASHA